MSTRLLVVLSLLAACTKSPSPEADNHAPLAPSVSIGPAGATTADDLVVTIDSASNDPDGDAVTYRYAWTKNGADASLSTETVSNGVTERDDVWAVSVIPSD